jgi:hydrogenase small subunit
VIWLSCQQCTGCSESILRSFDPTLENLLLNYLSLDYHESLQAAAGHQAEAARLKAMQDNNGRYVLIVDGAIPTGANEYWSSAAGSSSLATLSEAAQGAALIIALGSCASYGGIPAAAPNPSNASGVDELMQNGLIATRPLINVSGCPPIPEVITGTIAYFLVNGSVPELDALKRPKVFYGKTVHDCCPRLEHYNAGRFARSFDDDGARQGHCLYLLGCKGPESFNACSTVKWNQGTSSPTKSGHGCIGCSEPKFWDKPGGLYATAMSEGKGDGTSCSAVPHIVLPPL